jgi:outer membrane murein-binding lipoprotein Lpp
MLNELCEGIGFGASQLAKEVEQLRTEVNSLRSDVEHYRAASHAALQ